MAKYAILAKYCLFFFILVALASPQQLTLRQVPTGWQLSAIDELSLQIDDYVNMQGARIFSSTPSNTQVTTQHRIRLYKTTTTTDANFKSCGLSLYISPVLYILCDNTYLFKIELDTVNFVIKSISSRTIMNTVILARQPVCSHMVASTYNEFLYYICYDLNNLTNIYFYETSLAFNSTTSPSFSTDPSTFIRVTTCPNANSFLSGHLKFNEQRRSAFSQILVNIYVANNNPDPATAVGMRYISCLIPGTPLQNNNQSGAPPVATAKNNDVAAVMAGKWPSSPITEGNIKLILLKYVPNALLHDYSLLVITHQLNGEPALTTLTLGASVSDVSVMYNSTFVPKTFQAAELRSTQFNALAMRNLILSATIIRVYAADTKNLIRFTIKPSAVLPETMDITFDWARVIDCGVAPPISNDPAMAWDIRIPPSAPTSYIGNKFTEDSVMIQYRSKLASFEFKEFAVVIDANRFACSKPAGYDGATKFTSTFILGIIWNNPMVCTIKDTTFSFHRIFPKSIMTFKTLAAAGGSTVSFQLGADLPGTLNPEPVSLGVEALRTPLNFSRISLTTNTFKMYNQSKVVLPIPGSSYEGNFATYSTNSSQVKILNSFVYNLPKVMNVNTTTFPDGITRIYAIDSDTFLIVLRKANFQESFSIMRTTLTSGSTFTADYILNVVATATPSPTVDLGNSQVVFKAGKIGQSAFCVFIVGLVGGNKLSFQCFQDIANSPPITSIPTISMPSNVVSITEILILENGNPNVLDLLILADEQSSIQVSGQQTLAHTPKLYFFSLGYDAAGNAITLRIPFSNINMGTLDASMSRCAPQDLQYEYWGDNDARSIFTMRMSCGTYPNTSPHLIAKYTLSFPSPSTAPTLTFQRVISVDNIEYSYCSAKSELIIFQWKFKRMFGLKFISPDNNHAAQQKLYYPISDAIADFFIMQMVCLPEVGFVQILGVNPAKEKYVATFRMGESEKASRRMHSLQRVDAGVEYIESAVEGDVIVTICGQRGKENANIIYTYWKGPLIAVDTNGLSVMAQAHVFSLKAVTQSASSEQQVSIDTIPSIRVASVTPITKFTISPGQTVIIDDMAEVKGPILDVKLDGNTTNMTAIRRSERLTSYTPQNSPTSRPNPDKIMVSNDFMVTIHYDNVVNVFGDPTLQKTTGATTPKLIQSFGSSTSLPKDAVIISSVVNPLKSVLVIKYLESSTFIYRIYFLSSDNAKINPAYTITQSQGTYSTNYDFSTLQITEPKTGSIVIAVSSPRSFSANYIRLICFSRVPNSTPTLYSYLSQVMFVPSTYRTIGEYSLSHLNNDAVVVLGQFDGRPSVMFGTWKETDTDTEKSLLELNKQFRVIGGAMKQIYFSGIRCWPKDYLKLDCYINSEGVIDGLFEISFYPDMQAADPFVALTQLYEFEIPMNFEVLKIERGKDYYGLMLKKSSVSTLIPPMPSAPAVSLGSGVGHPSSDDRRSLQGVTPGPISNVLACANFIGIYRPAKSRLLHTAISCSELANNPVPDFAMDYSGKEYIYFSKETGGGWRRVLQGGSSARVGVNVIGGLAIRMDGVGEPAGVNITLFGLDGSALLNSAIILLKDLFYPKSTSTTSSQSSGQFINFSQIIFYALLILGIMSLLAIGAVLYCRLRARSKASKVNECYDPAYTGPAPQNSPNDFSSNFKRPGWNNYKKIDSTLGGMEKFDQYDLIFL